MELFLQLAYYTAISWLHMGMVSEETQRMGERVTYYQVNNAFRQKKDFLCFKNNFCVNRQLTVCLRFSEIGLLSQMSKEDHVTRKSIFHQFALKFKLSFWTCQSSEGRDEIM
jgi:hypothetical protein